tara:strand:- start:202 stop:1134 length:933 start_codon:yes stop_codon:yes gene_type:complete
MEIGAQSTIKIRTATNERMRITSDGVVQIGEEMGSNQADVLQCIHTDNSQTYSQNQNNAAPLVRQLTLRNPSNTTDTMCGINFSASSGMWWVGMVKYSNWASSPLVFGCRDGGSTWKERMRINGDGAVHIQGGGTNVTNRYFKFTAHSTSPYFEVNHHANNANHTLIHFKVAGSMCGEIKQDGDGTITYASSSDYRLKENVIDLTGAIIRIKNLKPRRFNFKVDPNLTKDGFLAHELQEVVPEAVNGTKDELVTVESKANNPTSEDLDIGDPVYQTADASRVVPLLTAALQELIAKVETLEAEVATLKGS